MGLRIRTLAVLSAIAASTLSAQAPGGPPPSGPRMPPTDGVRGAAFFLAHTGELDLTDAQVVKLAAIARRTSARQKGMRSAMDSARMRFGGPPTSADSASRRQFREKMRADFDRVLEQRRTDQRDALAVLTTDQAARAFEMVSSGGMRRGMGSGRGGMGGAGRGGMRRPGMMPPDGSAPRGFRDRDTMPRPSRPPETP